MCFIYCFRFPKTRVFSTQITYFTTSCATLSNMFKLFSSSAFVFEVMTVWGGGCYGNDTMFYQIMTLKKLVLL